MILRVYTSEPSEESSHPAFMKVGVGSELWEGKAVLFGMHIIDVAAAGSTGYTCRNLDRWGSSSDHTAEG